MSSNRPPHSIVQVDHVSKLYNLNANQGSLRSALADAAKRLVKRAAGAPTSALWALKDIDFELKPGESLGVVGPNGAGKTTLLKVLSRVTRPTSGKTTVNGRLAALIELGAGFHPELTGRENIALNGSILGLRRDEVRRNFDAIVAFSGLERFIDTPVKRYSSGMYVRLGFSVAAHINPDVLLVDEVLAVGDAEFRQKCVQRIRTLQQDGVGIIFISHNLFQVRSVCDLGIFLLNGQIQVRGSSDEAIGAYENWLRQSHKLNGATDQFGFSAGQGGNDLQVFGVELHNPAGQPQAQFHWDEPVEIRIHFVAHRRFPAPHFVARIYRTDGIVCAMLRSADLGCQLDDFIEGPGYISLQLDPLQLATGSYLIEIRLRDNRDAVTLAQGRSTAFSVDGPSPAFNNNGGIFIPHISRIHVVTEDGLEVAPGMALTPDEEEVGL